MHQTETEQIFYTPGLMQHSPHLGAKKRQFFKFDINQISEIWVGPRLNYEAAKLDIEKLLDNLGIKEHIHIHPSGIPYKNSWQAY